MNARLVLPSWLPTFEERDQRERWLSSQYYLVRISGNDGYDVMRCKRCNGRHPYLTLMCEPQPFDGATRGVYAFYHALGIAGAEMSMSPADRARFAKAARMFGPSKDLPHLATSHPETARSLKTEEDAADIGAFPLGKLEPIPRTMAQKLLDRINATGLQPPLVVPGLITNGKVGVLAPLSGGNGHAPIPGTG
jgi:hypothetical protein